MKSFSLKINGLKQNIYTWGNSKNPKIFFFHGWLDTGASFDFVCQHLQNKFYCIAPDMRGYGKSEHTQNPLGYFFVEYVADAWELLHQLSPKEKLNIVGHSLGGYVASHFSGAYPERVSRLINIEGFGIPDRKPEEGPGQFKKWMEGIHQKRFNIHLSLADFAKRLMQKNPRLLPERALFLAKHLTQKTKKGFIMSADPKHKLVEPYLVQLKNVSCFWQNIQAKCLLVLGEKTETKDFITQKEIKKRMSLFPKGTKTITIAGAGHMLHHEKPKELAKAIIFNNL